MYTVWHGIRVKSRAQSRQSFDLYGNNPYNWCNMREWNLGPDDPLQLTMAADARLCTPDYANDHIWELDLRGGDPGAIGLRTTYGLRARLMRLFPRFTENGKVLSDPDAFTSAPRLRRFYPNFLEVTFSPIAGVDVTAEYWAPLSQVVAGRLTIANHAVVPHPLRLEWIGQLVPLNGQPMTVSQRQSVTVLEGQVEDMFPVLFMTGGPVAGPGPYASLSLMVDLAPGGRRQFNWALASLKDVQESFDTARRLAARPFDAEKANIELLNASQSIEIHTSDSDWDAALAFSQKAAFSLLSASSEHLPNPSFVLSRKPDQGYSQLGDGTDYQHFWNGQPVLETYYLSSILSGAAKLTQGLLENYLAVQENDGFIDCRPGLAGQRGRFLASPYLSSLAWQLYENGLGTGFLAQVYPSLHSFFWSWFSPARDHDRNGLPEWQHSLQTGFEDNPLFDGWHEWAQGVNIASVQSPALAAALYREAHCLVRMAELIGRVSDLPLLKKQAEVLRQGIESCWDDDGAFYHYADRDTHLTLSAKLVSKRRAAPEISLQKTFKQPVRLLIRIHGQGEALKRPHVTIAGALNGKKQSERLDRQDFTFSASGGVATTRRVYTEVGDFTFEGLSSRDRIIIQTVDLTMLDHTLLLPLWAGVPSAHEAQALVYRTVMDAAEFDHPFGIPALPHTPVSEADAICMSVHLPWNQLIGEGLLAYGYRREAARLTAHIMSAVIQNLKRSHAFYHAYHAETGAGLGEQNALNGLAPVGLFLQTLGVEILSPTRVRLRGENPFPWPVTVKYRGLTVTRQTSQTEIIFPNGQVATLDDPTDAILSCE